MAKASCRCSTARHRLARQASPSGTQSRVSRDCLPQHGVVEGEVCHLSLQPLDLPSAQAAALLAPSGVGLFADTQRTCDLADGQPLAQEELSLPQLPNDLFRSVAPCWHAVLPPVVHRTWPSGALSQTGPGTSGGTSWGSPLTAAGAFGPTMEPDKENRGSSGASALSLLGHPFPPPRHARAERCVSASDSQRPIWFDDLNLCGVRHTELVGLGHLLSRLFIARVD